MSNHTDLMKMLHQMGDRKSIINQLDVHSQQVNDRKVTAMAQLDGQSVIPAQIWYDSLRENDNGQFSDKNVVAPDAAIDYQFKQAANTTSRENLMVKKRVLSGSSSTKFK